MIFFYKTHLKLLDNKQTCNRGERLMLVLILQTIPSAWSSIRCPCIVLISAGSHTDKNKIKSDINIIVYIYLYVCFNIFLVLVLWDK